MKYHPKTKPFKHQVQATLKAARRRNYAVFFEPRLGKSKVALDWVGILALKGEVRRVLIVAPRIALDVWEQQIPMHFPMLAAGETFTESWVFNQSPPRGSGYEKLAPVKFFLAGREETFRAVRVKYKTRSGRTKTRLERRKQDEVEAWNPDAIIIDESHEYKRPGGRGAQDAWRLVRKLRGARRTTLSPTRPYVLLLSGTPNPRGWRDIFSQYRIMDEEVLGTNAGEFDQKYCVYGQGPRKYTVIRYRNLKRLKRIIQAHSSACSARQAGLEGKIFWQRLRVQLPPKVRATYEQMAEEFATEVSGQLLTAKNQGVKRLRLLQITGGFTTATNHSGGAQQIHREKVVALERYASVLLEQGESVLVYCRFRAEVDAARASLEGVGYSTSVLDGRTPRGHRAQIVAQFQKSRKPRALVAQVQAGQVSIELSNAAEVVFFSLPDGWVQFWQCLNRVRGPNQKRPVRITAIIAVGTVDLSVLSSLRRKEDVHGEMMRDPKRYLLGL